MPQEVDEACEATSGGSPELNLTLILERSGGLFHRARVMRSSKPLSSNCGLLVCMPLAVGTDPRHDCATPTLSLSSSSFSASLSESSWPNLWDLVTSNLHACPLVSQHSGVAQLV